MQNTVDERKQNGDDFFLSLAVTYFRSGNCPANGLVTEITQYPARICFAANWQNYEILLILNHLQFISLIFTFRCFCLNCAHASPFVCHAPAGARNRPENHTGTAGA